VNRIAVKSSKNDETRFVRLILSWGKKNDRSFPWRKDRNPYKVLLAEILLQRTPANRVLTFFPRFIYRFPDPHSVMSTSINDLEEYLTPMGLKKRAKWMIGLMKDVCQKYDGRIPAREDELTDLLGIGRYTARAVLCFGFKKDVAIVDVNVVRVLSRVFGLPERKKRPHADVELWNLASKLIPRGKGPEFNEALLDFAALICPVNEICEHYASTLTRTS
jgi:A/G-specific adenine glycosylase